MLVIDHDIDGVVLELGKLEDIKLALPHLTMPSLTLSNVKPHFHMLKKHVNWSESSPEAQRACHNIYSMCLGRLNNGWFLNATLVPADLTTTHYLLLEKAVAI